jgi:colanic acid biosynthesis glycosyl transferase WcaI
MRICFFNRTYWPDAAATGQLLAELAEDLVNRHGWEATVVVGRPTEVQGLVDHASPGRMRAGAAPVGWLPVRRERHNNVEVFRALGTGFSRRRFAGRAANYVSYFLSACLAGFRVRRPDVVASLTDPPIIGLAALLTARRSGAKFVFLCQDIFPEVAVLLEDFRNETVNRALDRINRFLLRKADRVIALGETMRQRLIRDKGADPEKIRVIHNWVDCEAVVPGYKRNPFSMAHGLADRFVVMHSGNVGLSQNLDTFLEAAAELRAYDDIVFAVIGDGAKRRALEARARAEHLDNVRFFPYQPKAALSESFAAADVFVVGLRAGLAGSIVPSKVYGILAAGRPYVAAVEEACEAAEIARKYDAGLVAVPGDGKDLADKILTLYRDRALARRLGANARQAAFDFDRVTQVGAYEALFREIAADCARSGTRRGPLAKRILDVAVSGLGLVCSMPVWGLIAVAIKLDDRGPVFYGQERVGQGGRRFRGWKFRSMRPDSDATFGPLQAREADPRVTRVGRLLRATALDELPQLWNIFRGDMSLVGPRALAPREIEVGGHGESVSLEKVPGYEARHRVRPGLTGIAQIYAPRDITRRQKFRLDLLYVKRQSLWLDLKLIALSFWISARGRWEHRGQKL